MERAWQDATRRGMTLTALIEQGLSLALRRPLKRSRCECVSLSECKAGGGILPRVDLNDSVGLLERMEGRG